MRSKVPEIISRSDAARAGLDRYFTGRPCKSGHLAGRRIGSYHCMECASLASMASGKKNIAGRQRNNLAFRTKNPAKIRDRRLRSKYGISLEDRDRMFESQGKCCAVCRSPDPGSYGRWNTDHCHTTGKVRGILCQPCNMALGFARDSVSTLKGMIVYLEQHSNQ